MNRIGGKTDFAVIGVTNLIVWLAQFDAPLKTLFTLLSVVFLGHRYVHWLRNKDRKTEEDR